MSENNRFDGVRSVLSRPKTWTAILLVVGIAAVALYSFFVLVDRQVVIKSKTFQIDKLEGDEIALQNAKQLSVEDGKHVISSAREAGEAVATIQNDYARVSADKLREQTSKLDTYFAENDYGSKSMWYLIRSVKGAKWDFYTPYLFSGTYADVVWQCKKDGQLLAYVTATYNSVSGKFTNVNRHVTKAGSQMYKAQVEDDTLKQHDSLTYDEDMANKQKSVGK